MMELIITPAGQVRTIYGELILLHDLGAPEIRRASAVEPQRDGTWMADLTPVGGPVLGPFRRRSDALDAEVAWLTQFWLPAGHASQHRAPVPQPAVTWDVWLALLLACLVLFAACDERENAQKRQADAQRQVQELRHQLEQERAQRLRAEQAAAAAAQSRASWIAGLAAAGIVGCVLAGAWGIHVGSRAVAHYRKENADVL